MKNLIRTSTGDPERNPNSQPMHCGEYDPRQVHDHQHSDSPQSSCFAPKSEHLTALEQQQRLFPCASGPHMLPMATRSFSCSQLTGLVDYSSETIKQQQQHQHQQHCKSEKHDEDGAHLSGKCQMHSNSGGVAADGGSILVKTEFNEMQQSKSSPVHEAFEMTSSAFTSTVTGSGSASATNQYHHDSGSPPLPLMDAANSSSSSSAATHHLQHHHQQHHHHHHQPQHQCPAHSYESYVYASGSRVGMSPRATMNSTSSGLEISGALYNCKSFFADSGNASSGIASFYPNSSQHQHSNGESCRDDGSGSGFPGRDSLDAAADDEKVVIAIKARKMSD